MILHLVRHGQSTWNLERRLQGQTMDVPLTDLGLRQAVDVAARLDGLPVLAVVSSDQLRATQTARVIAERLGAELVATDLLREQGMGDLEGVGYDDLTEEVMPPSVHISEVRWGGGESVQDVHARLTRFVHDLRRCHPDDSEIVLVSHGDALRILLAVLEGRGHREVEWTEFGNGEVVTRIV